MITLDMVKRGYEQGMIRLIESPDDGFVVCGIGSNYFYFGAGEFKPDEFLAQVSPDVFLKDIFEVLDSDFRGSPEFDEEYRYYETFLKENLDMITLDMVKKGYEAGIVQVVADPDNKGVLGKIGGLCFTFGGWDACELDLDDFLRNWQGERLIESLYKGLLDLRTEVEMDEFVSCSAYLREQLEKLPAEPVREETEERPMENMREKALQFVKNNTALAYEIFRVVDKDYYKEDIVGKLKDMGVDVEQLTDADIRKMAERFENILDHNDGYWESYWLSAEAAIDEVMEEKSTAEAEKALGWNSIEEMVDKAVAEIRGVGADMGSGYFCVKDFDVAGEKMELVVEFCQFENKETGEAYYGVYYWVGYYGDDSLMTDWEYTSSLDVDELKTVVRELSNRDFTEDILKAMGKNVDSVLDAARTQSGGSVHDDRNPDLTME